MYNLKLKHGQQKLGVIKNQMFSVEEDIPSDDEWITKTKDHIPSTNDEFLNALEKALQEGQVGDEDEVPQTVICMNVSNIHNIFLL